MFLGKYGVARHIYIPIIKRAVVDFAVGADWTPAAGDVKISKDGGAAANVSNLPTALTMGNAALWDFSLTATEMQAAQIMVTVADSATKAVEDQSFIIQTHGNASAMFQADLADSVRLGLTALPNAAAEAAGGLYTRGSGAGQINQNANGQVDTRIVAITAGIIAAASFAANALDAVWSTATRTLSAAGVQAIWDALTSALTTAGSVGKLLVDNVNATISSRLASASYTAPLDAAGTRTAVGLASANLDTQLAAVPTANANADALLDRANGVETSFTLRQALRLVLAACAGKLSGAATATVVIRDVNDTKDRISATVDASGNRSAVTKDVS